MTRISSFIAFLTACIALSSAATTKTYQPLAPTAYTSLRNPARGLIYQQDIYLSDPSTFPSPSDLSYDLNPKATPNMTVAQLMIYLDTAISSTPLTTTTLTALTTLISTVRSLGAKAVLRFGYTSSQSANLTEPPLLSILQHITQLTSLFQTASDVLLNVQQGFIGVWGEGYYTTHFGNLGIINSTAQSARNAVTTALLAAIPEPIQLQLRTPAFEQAYLNSSAVPVDAATAFGASAGARLGHFDDCFLASPDDEGTYRDTALSDPDHAYVAQTSRWTVRGGETCTPSGLASLYKCARALEVLEQEHWTWLHVWNAQYVSAWKKQGCWDTIRARLGHWLTLEESVWMNGMGEDEGVVGWEGLTVGNQGFATPMLGYSVEVLFVPEELLGVAPGAGAVVKAVGARKTKKGNGKTGGQVSSTVGNGNYTGFAAALPLDTFDVRNWTASADGGNTTLPSVTFCLDADTAANTNTTYELFWNIYDAAATTTPAYKILLGNVGMTTGPSWIANTRVNRLGLSATGAGLSSSAAGAGCDVVLSQKTFAVNAQGVLIW